MWNVYCAEYKDGRSYVGQTMRNMDDRISSHYTCAISNSSNFQLMLKKTDPKDWKWNVLKKVNTLNEAFHWEAFYIAEKKCYIEGFNTPSGHSGRLSDDAREKMKIAKKEFTPWNKGRVGIYSDETLSRMAIAKLGNKNNIRESRRVKITEAHHKSTSRKVINSDTGEIYPSISMTAKCIGIALSTVKRILNGKIKRSIYNIKYYE